MRLFLVGAIGQCIHLRLPSFDSCSTRYKFQAYHQSFYHKLIDTNNFLSRIGENIEKWNENTKVKSFTWNSFCQNFPLLDCKNDLRLELTVWPVNSHQMSIKVVQKWFHKKNEIFWHLYKNCQKMGQFGQNNCCHSLWKVAQTAINRPIWSHWSVSLFTLWVGWSSQSYKQFTIAIYDPR